MALSRQRMCFDAFRDISQRGVPGGMAKPVIDGFEPNEIYEKQTNSPVPAICVLRR